MNYLIGVTLLWSFSFSLIGVYLAGQVDAYFSVLTRIALASLVFLPFPAPPLAAPRSGGQADGAGRHPARHHVSLLLPLLPAADSAGSAGLYHLHPHLRHPAPRSAGAPLQACLSVGCPAGGARGCRHPLRRPDRKLCAGIYGGAGGQPLFRARSGGLQGTAGTGGGATAATGGVRLLLSGERW